MPGMQGEGRTDAGRYVKKPIMVLAIPSLGHSELILSGVDGQSEESRLEDNNFPARCASIAMTMSRDKGSQAEPRPSRPGDGWIPPFPVK